MLLLASRPGAVLAPPVGAVELEYGMDGAGRLATPVVMPMDADRILRWSESHAGEGDGRKTRN